MIDYIKWVYERLNKVDFTNRKCVAIYGTGEALSIIYQYFEDEELLDKLKYIIDADESDRIGTYIYGIRVSTLNEVCERIDSVVVAAKIHHCIIQERINKLVRRRKLSMLVVNPFIHENSDNDCIEYVKCLEKIRKNDKSCFVEFKENDISYKKNETRVIAWYLPQFHKMEINDKYHGKGFTEWTNTSQTMPQYIGHYQPHIPYDVGYYDLLNVDTFKRQIMLAKNYGIYGFAFHYYWFSGKRIMEKPIELFLEHKELDFPFCVNWANENWTSLWDGGNDEVMLEQEIKAEDDEAFAHDLLRLFCDDRYIKVNGKPLFSIYRSDLCEKKRFKDLIFNLRKYAKEAGFDDLFILITTATKNKDDVRCWGADGLVEFPPHRLYDQAKPMFPEGYINPNFKGGFWSMKSYIEQKKFLVDYKTKKVFRTTMVSFDNTSRRGYQGCSIFYDITPELYEKWLFDIIIESNQKHGGDEKMVFVNAWNEWAEGAHLEPDLKFGYAYLQATANAILESRKL